MALFIRWEYCCFYYDIRQASSIVVQAIMVSFLVFYPLTSVILNSLCFLAVHEVLGLTGSKFQSLYHFTVGDPVVDRRIMSLPAYPGPNIDA